MKTIKEQIVELTDERQWLEAFPVMRQLRTDLDEGTYIELLKEMTKDGYRLFALYNDASIIALAGVSLRTNFYNKRHVFVYDLVTDAAHRSQGNGYKLLTYIHAWGAEHGAEYVALESGVQRIDSHRFYEDKLDYTRFCYSFRKQLV
jgi:GNAT superfamily N-acetyltransferase